MTKLIPDPHDDAIYAAADRDAREREVERLIADRAEYRRRFHILRAAVEEMAVMGPPRGDAWFRGRARVALGQVNSGWLEGCVKAKDLEAGDRIDLGWHTGVVVEVRPSGRWLKVTYDSPTVVNPPGVDYCGPDHMYRRASAANCPNPRCEYGQIVHPPSVLDRRVGESRRWHTPCPDCNSAPPAHEAEKKEDKSSSSASREGEGVG